MQEKTSPEGSGTTSSEADDAGLFADGGGPKFEPGQAPKPEPAPAPAAAIVDVDWQESQVRSVLETQGHVLHSFVAIDKHESEEWIYTRSDLAAIAPPLTRILNRYDVTRAAAGTSDELMVAVGFGGYAVRSWGQRRAALARHDDDQADDAVPGEPAAGDEEVAEVTELEDVDTPPTPRRRR